jgi:hypothetical protein
LIQLQEHGTYGPRERTSLSQHFLIPLYNLFMQHTFEEVQQIAHELPEDQRVLLANSLWESVGSENRE